MNNDITTEVMRQLETLPEDLQRQVLEFVQAMQMLARRGAPGKQLRQFAGAIPPHDLELMRQAIDQECDRVDLDEW